MSQVRCAIADQLALLQMKKACLTVRQQQMSQLQQKGELPLSMMDQVGREGLAATLPRPLPPPKRQSSDFSDLAVDKPKRKPQQPSLDLFTREIQVSYLAYLISKSTYLAVCGPNRIRFGPIHRAVFFLPNSFRVEWLF